MGEARIWRYFSCNIRLQLDGTPVTPPASVDMLTAPIPISFVESYLQTASSLLAPRQRNPGILV